MYMNAGQQYSVQTFEQQSYAIARQIKSSRPLEFRSHIISFRGFHSVACLILHWLKVQGCYKTG